MKQAANESISNWSVRLQHIVFKFKSASILQEPAARDILKHRFWIGLNNENLKGITRHLFHSCVSFENLLFSVRQTELKLSHAEASTLGYSNSTSSSCQSELLSKALTQLENLSKDKKFLSMKVKDIDNATSR